MLIYQSIQDFISLALQNGTIEPLDELYHRNQLLHFLGLNDWAERFLDFNGPTFSDCK